MFSSNKDLSQKILEREDLPYPDQTDAYSGVQDE
jgi:hypothetical protein